ncbi:MAG: NeuD/PglB/VioB family sugar acetyltransferase [Paludibacteraceae bacterium]|nr:NeuD/PglB/VioB family sugar acetyltransferase [Paludibacteraceae bacterium]
MKDIAIYGAGGFGREVACLINQINDKDPKWNIIGFFDDGKEVGLKTEYGDVLGDIKTLNSWDKPLDLVVAIGNPVYVKLIVENITNPLIDFPNIIAPTTTFLDKSNVRFGKGNIVCNDCMISCNIKISDFNIFNGHIPVGHDCIIGNYNVIMPSVNISGGVEIGDSNFFGVQSVILQYIKIGNNVRIGANSVMMRNAKDGYLYMGNPAMKMKL